MNMYINGIEVVGDFFAYDGCHKIYVCEDKEDIKSSAASGYDLYDICDLEEAYNSSCELKFINNWKLTKAYVEQYHDARFEYK